MDKTDWSGHQALKRVYYGMQPGGERRLAMLAVMVTHEGPFYGNSLNCPKTYDPDLARLIKERKVMTCRVEWGGRTNKRTKLYLGHLNGTTYARVHQYIAKQRKRER